MKQTLDRWLSAVPASALAAGCFAQIALIGALDVLTGPELAVSIFYLVPVGIIAWYGSMRWAVVIGLCGAALWLYLDATVGRPYEQPLAAYWNAGVRFGFFFIVAYLLVSLRARLRAEAAAASTDALTGALNSRGFYERLELEISRSARYARRFSLAYLDLDNFKQVNDRYGHTTGDDLLRTVAEIARESTRKTDHVARLGGDEFALLLVESGSDEAAHAIDKLRARIAERMAEQSWPVQVSVGVVSFDESPPDAKEAIRLADDLMYRVKKTGKNSVIHQRWADGALAET